MKNSVRLCSVACAAWLAGLGPQSAPGQSANYTWGGGTSSDWTVTNNWSGGNMAPTGGVYDVRLNIVNGGNNPLVHSAAQGHTIYDPTNNSLARALVIGNSTARGAMEITGGTFESRADQADILGNFAGASTLTISGGNYVSTNQNASGNADNTLLVLYTTANATAVVNVASGSMAVRTIQFGNSGAAANGLGAINLNGGTLSVEVIRRLASLPATTDTEINFNGGTLQALSNRTDFLQGLTRANISTNGAIIDNNGFSVTIGQSLLHDASLGATPDGGLRKIGAGTLTLTNGNTYTGQTTIETGVLQIRHGAALGASGGGTVVSNGARVDMVGSITVTNESITINGIGGNNQGALQAIGGTSTWDGPVILRSGTGNNGTRVGAASAGTLRLTGPITTNGGNWDFAARSDAPNSTVVVAGTNNAWRDTYAVVGGLQIDGGDDRLPAGTVLHIGNAANVSGATFDLNGFNQRIAGLVSDGTFMPMVVTNGQAGLATLTVNNAATRAFGGISNNAQIGGNLSLVKTGSGTLDLSSDNTYSGPTVISNGVLAMNGTHIGGGQYTIHGGATLRGTGIIEAAVLSLTNGTVAPGNSIGTLTFHGDAELDGILQIELDGAGLGFSDVLVVTGALDISQTILDFNVLGALDDGAYIFATYGSLAGAEFASIQDLPSGYGVVYGYGGNNIALVIPEPPAFVLSALGLFLVAASLRRRR